MDLTATHASAAGSVRPSGVLTCNACGHDSFEQLVVKDGYDIARCRHCGLVFVANPPTAEQLSKLYSFEDGYHLQLTADEHTIAHHAHEAAMNLRRLERYATKGRLLDIGCSTGLFLEGAVQRGWPAEGLEYSADSAEEARTKRGLNVRTGALQRGLYEPGSFHVITLWDVIEHVPDPRSVLQMASELLAPGGTLIVKTPNCDGLYPRLSLTLAGRLGFWGHADPPGHLYQFSVGTLSSLVEPTGLSITDVEHGRIPLEYSFGKPSGWFRSAKWAAYCAAFLPIAWLGPIVRQGDDFTLVARRAAA